MRRSLGHYVRTGYGGSGTATRRFGGTAATAGALGGALARVAAGQPAAPGSPLDPALLAGRNAQEVMDAVVEAVRPVDGTQHAEAERAAIRDALSELLTKFPEADLLNLEPEQRAFAIERFTAIDVFRRFELDVGKTIVEKAPTADLVTGQTDEGDIGISYAKADRILHWLLHGFSVDDLVARGFPREEVDIVRQRLERTHWKRRPPTVAMLSATAIGESYLRPVDY